MAVGDVTSAYSNDLADDGYMSIQPGAGVEWVIHNIYCGDDAEIYWFDGTNYLLFYTVTGANWITGIFSHVTNTIYIKVKNVSGGTADFGYDGVITKAA
jgi:hypothetical protein